MLLLKKLPARIAAGEACWTLMLFVIAKPTSFSLLQSRKGKPCSHFEEYLKPTVASSFSFLCCAVECLIMKHESFLFLSCECSSCFMGQIGWVLCVPFWCCLYHGEGGKSTFTEVLNLEWLEVSMCIWGSFQLFRLKTPEEAELWPSMVELKGQFLGTRNLLVLYPSEYHKWQICTPCERKDSFSVFVIWSLHCRHSCRWRGLDLVVLKMCIKKITIGSGCFTSVGLVH